MYISVKQFKDLCTRRLMSIDEGYRAIDFTHNVIDQVLSNCSGEADAINLNDLYTKLHDKLSEIL